MDESFWIPLAFLIVLTLIFLVVILPILTWKRTKRLARDSAKTTDVQSLIGRIYALEQAVKELRAHPAATPPKSPIAEAVADEKREEAAAPSAAKAQTPPPTTPLTPTPTPPIHASPQVPPPQAARPAPTATPLASPPLFAGMRASAPKAAKTADPQLLANLEETLGTNWLNKIGTAAFVIGVALLINYSLHYFGPVGKIALGYGIAVIFLALGVFGERNERYRIGARAVLGGGWALAYFVTYALHNIPSVRLVDDPLIGFALLFAVAAAMVAHSLRYHSEVTTGFAFLLAYLSVAVSIIPFGALIASALLSAALVVILRQRRWYAIEPFAIIAAYIVHWVWLTQIYERQGGHKPFPEFQASAAILTLYWMIFIASYFLRPDGGTTEKRWLTASFILNALGYLVVLHQQSFHPEWRFRFLLFAGAVYLGIAYLARRQKRQLGYLLGSTLGVGSLVAAFPYRTSGAPLELIWALQIEALFVAGWRLADRHLRRLGWAASIVLSAYVFFHDVVPRIERWRPPDPSHGWFVFCIAGFFIFFFRAERRRNFEVLDAFEELVWKAFPVIGTLYLLAAPWIGLHWMLVGLTWALSACALLELARVREFLIPRYCAYGTAAAAVARLTLINIPSTTTYYGYSVRVITVAGSVALFYLIAPRSATEPAPAPTKSAQSKFTQFRESPAWQAFLKLGGFPTLFAGSATLLLSLLLWEEVANAGVALAWGILAIALLETGEEFKGLGLIGQGRLLLIAAFARIFFADLNATARIGPVTSRTLTVTVLAAIFYWAATKSGPSRWRVTYLWLGTIAIAALARFELPISWVAVAWAILAAALYALGQRISQRALRLQCYTFTVLTTIRCAFDNFYQRGPWYFTNIRVATVSAVAIIFLALAFTSRRIKLATAATPTDEKPESANSNLARVRTWIAVLDRYPYHLFFFTAAILITRLLSIEIHHGYLTAAWGAEAIVVFLIALRVNERSYRWCALILLLLCVGRIVLIDVWTLDQLGRIVSFMGLGAALLIVSFLYARHRELLRKVL